MGSRTTITVPAERGGKFHRPEKSRRLRLYECLGGMQQRVSTCTIEFAGIAATSFGTHQ